MLPKRLQTTLHRKPSAVWATLLFCAIFILDWLIFLIITCCCKCRFNIAKISPTLHKKNPGPTLNKKTRLYRISHLFQTYAPINMWQWNLQNLIDCVNIWKRLAAAKASILINSCTELIKAQFFPVNILQNLVTIRASMPNFISLTRRSDQIFGKTQTWVFPISGFYGQSLITPEPVMILIQN